MKKLLTIIVIIMTIAAVAVVARAGDDFDLKKKVEFQNTIYVVGISDTSLTRSNDAPVFAGTQISSEEVICTYLSDTWQSSMFYRENGGMSYQGITMIDEFRCGVKLADILFFADTIKLKVALNQRLYTYVEDIGSGTGNGNILDYVNFYVQYRSYLDMTMEFGNDVVKYTLNPYIQVRMIFDGQAGIDSVRIYPYLGHKIAIKNIMDIQQSTEYMIRWYALTSAVAADQKNVDSTLSLDVRFGSPGLAGGGAHYLNAFAKRANGYDLGPISLSWFLRLSLDLDMNNARYKDTDPGSAVDAVSNSYISSGIMKAWKFRMRYAEVWINPLKNMKLIGLNIGVSDYLEMAANWSYNNPYTITIINELKVGAELVLDKTFVVGLFLKMRTTDYANAWGVPLNGKFGATDQWANQNSDVGNITVNGEQYQKIPAGNGIIGPNIYVGVSKGAFEWMFGWHGWTSFRNYDLVKTGPDQDFIESKFTSNSQAYFSWRNEIESWVTWKW